MGDDFQVSHQFWCDDWTCYVIIASTMMYYQKYAGYELLSLQIAMHYEGEINSEKKVPYL